MLTAWRKRPGGPVDAPHEIGTLFPKAVRLMYTPVKSVDRFAVAQADWDMALENLEAALLVHDGAFLYGHEVGADDCALAPRMHSAFVALGHVREWQLSETQHPAIERFWKACLRHPLFPVREAAQVVAAHEATIDGFVAGQLDHAREAEDELVGLINKAVAEPDGQTVVAITIMEGRDLYQPSTFLKSDPYVIVTVDGQEVQSSTKDNGGAEPSWMMDGEGERLEFTLPRSWGLVPVSFTIKDEDSVGEDSLIGSVELAIGHGGQLAGWTTSRWIVLHRAESSDEEPDEEPDPAPMEEASGFAGKARQKAKEMKHKAAELKRMADIARKEMRAQKVSGPNGAGRLHFKVECIAANVGANSIAAPSFAVVAGFALADEPDLASIEWHPELLLVDDAPLELEDGEGTATLLDKSEDGARAKSPEKTEAKDGKKKHSGKKKKKTPPAGGKKTPPSGTKKKSPSKKKKGSPQKKSASPSKKVSEAAKKKKAEEEEAVAKKKAEEEAVEKKRVAEEEKARVAAEEEKAAAEAAAEAKAQAEADAAKAAAEEAAAQEVAAAAAGAEVDGAGEARSQLALLPEQESEATLEPEPEPGPEPEAVTVDFDINRQRERHLATIMRAEQACQVIASRSDYLEGLGRLTLLPPDHMTGWGWDAREYVNKLHDRAAVTAAERLPLKPQSDVLYIGCGNPTALYTLAARMRRTAQVQKEATEGDSSPHAYCGSLVITDHDDKAVHWTARRLAPLISRTAEAGFPISLAVATRNPIPPRHPDGRALTGNETMAMDPDVYDMSYRELQALVRGMFKQAKYRAIHGQPLTATSMELQQAIMRARRDATWGAGATSHSHLPFRAATFDGIIVHPSGRHLQPWPLSELRRLLRPGGTLIIPARKWPLQIEPPFCASPFPTMSDLRNAAADTGLVRVRSEAVSTPPPTPLKIKPPSSVAVVVAPDNALPLQLDGGGSFKNSGDVELPEDVLAPPIELLHAEEHLPLCADAAVRIVIDCDPNKKAALSCDPATGYICGFKESKKSSKKGKGSETWIQFRGERGVLHRFSFAPSHRSDLWLADAGSTEQIAAMIAGIGRRNRAARAAAAALESKPESALTPEAEAEAEPGPEPELEADIVEATVLTDEEQEAVLDRLAILKKKEVVAELKLRGLLVSCLFYQSRRAGRPERQAGAGRGGAAGRQGDMCGRG